MPPAWDPARRSAVPTRSNRRALFAITCSCRSLSLKLVQRDRFDPADDLHQVPETKGLSLREVEAAVGAEPETTDERSAA